MDCMYEDLTKRQRRYLQICSTLSDSSPYNHKHGAVLVKNGRIVQTGYNQDRYCHFSNRFFKRTSEGYHLTLHAEAAAILGVGRSITTGAEVYVIRKNRAGEMRLSKPCASCTAMLEYIGIKRVIYSVNDTEYAELRLNNG